MTGREEFARAELLLGAEAMDRLRGAYVAVFGLGGVGGTAAEAVTRGGIERIALFDCDTISITNINRQVLALHSTMGIKKTAAAAARLHDINPHAEIEPHDLFFTAENADTVDFSRYDYVIDAIDTVSSKLLIIECCHACGTPLICSMGTGNKLDPSRLRVGDIYETSVCPLARVMRRECRARGVKSLQVVFSDEKPTAAHNSAEHTPDCRPLPGSVSFVPPAAGLLLASHVIKALATKKI